MSAVGRNLAVLAALAGAVVALDQATKAWVLATFAYVGETKPVIPGLFHFTYLRNPGAAFSFLASQPEAFRIPFFITVTAVALAVIVVLVWRLPAGRPWTLSALSLVCGGAIGNLVDRVRWGEVVDFLDVFWRTHHWPPFNVADSAITVGMAILIGEELFGRKAGTPGG